VIPIVLLGRVLKGGEMCLVVAEVEALCLVALAVERVDPGWPCLNVSWPCSRGAGVEGPRSQRAFILVVQRWLVQV